MIQSIGVHNFRSLYEIDPIEIKPITILLGKNSCGKSSFLRLLPLLKQSVSNNIRGSIAMYGDMVDFGDFNTVLNKKSKKKSFKLQFRGFVDKENFPHIRSIYRNYDFNNSFNFDITITIKNSEKEDFLYISDFDLIIDEYRIKISIERRSCYTCMFCDISNCDFLSTTSFNKR